MVVFETWTAIPFLSSNLFTACLCSKYASSVSDLSHLCKLGHSSDKEFHTTPFFFSAGTGFFTFIRVILYPSCSFIFSVLQGETSFTDVILYAMSKNYLTVILNICN